MARSNLRKAPGLESLESRQVLSSGGPTEQAQYMLEVLNLARTNPVEGAKWVASHADSTIQANLNHYGVNLGDATSAIASAPARQPLAWDSRLAAAAQQHADDMAAKGYQSHEQSDEATRTVDRRLDRAGYTRRASYAENAFAYVRPSASDNSAPKIVQSLDNSLEAFLIDWGVAGAPHRGNIQQPGVSGDQSFADAGIGIANVTRNDLLAGGFGPRVVTQVFGREVGDNAQILGVVFEDADNNGRFSFREGRGDVRVDIENLNSGETSTLQTWDAGGYQLSVAPGSYKVTARLGNRSLGSKTVSVGDQNVKIDFQVSAAALAQTNDRTEAPAVNQTQTRTPAAPAATRSESAPAPANRSLISARALRSAFFNESNAGRVVSGGVAVSNNSAPTTNAPALSQPAQVTSAELPAAANNRPVETAPEAQSLTTADQDGGQTVVREVLGKGLLRDWIDARIVWGQSWKAMASGDAGR